MRTSTILVCVAVLALLLVGAVEGAKPVAAHAKGAAAWVKGAAPPARAKVIPAKVVVPRTTKGAAPSPPATANQSGRRVTESPALFAIVKQKGSVAKDALGAFHPRGRIASAPTTGKDWTAARRVYKLKQLAARANTAKNTKTEKRVGVRAAQKSGPKSKAAKTGAFPRPTGARGKFVKTNARNKNVLAFGRGAATKVVATPKAAAKKRFVQLQSFDHETDAAMFELEADADSDVESDAEIETEADGESETEADGESDANTDGESDADEPRSLVESEVLTVVDAEVVAGDLKLPSGLVVTAAQITAITAAFARQPTARVFYHWADYQAAIRWGRDRKLDQGEVDWLNTQNAGMAAGGGFYLAQDPKGSYGYGPVPCYIFTPVGALVMDITQAPIVAVLGKPLSNEDKAILGGVIPFIHSYSVQNGWWVTHHAGLLSNLRCGNAIITPDPLGPNAIPNPTVNVDTYMDVRKAGVPANARFVSVHFDQLNGQVVTARNIATHLDAHNYVLTMMDEQWDPSNSALGQDVKNAASWVNSFFVLMSYIDGPSLVRAKKLFPSDPWSAFEPNNFGNFLNTFNTYVKNKIAGKTWGIVSPTAMTFGNGEGAAAWAQKMVDTVLPGLYSDLSGGGELQFRTESVRAGGPVGQDPNNIWTTGQFVATAGQVAIMQSNPYLSVETGGPAAGDATLVNTNYFYPDPLRIAGMVKDPTLMSPAMVAQIQKNGDYSAAGQAALASDTRALMKDALIQLFSQQLYGKPACTATEFQWALYAALRLVSIHPCSDFNGRSTRFFMFISALEGCGHIPVSFMSDFDIVTQFAKYNQFMNDANVGYLQLKVAMLAELISSLANNVVARQYDLPEWGTFLTQSLASFGTRQFASELTAAEMDLVQSRQFVPLMDQWFGKNWPSRNAK